MRYGRSLLFSLVAVVLTIVPSTASAGVIVPSAPTVSATSGLALGADGNVWAAENFANSIVRLSPSGAVVLPRYSTAGEPRSVATGPGGTIWVTVPSQRQIIWFDTTVAAPTANVISTGGPGVCGPSAIVDGGNGRMYFSTETEGCVTNPGRIGSVNATSKLLDAATTPGAGQVFDLAVSNGKLFAPDFGGDVIRRYTLGAPAVLESTVAVPAGGGPDGITATGDGTIWVTLVNSGHIARFAAVANGGNATVAPSPPGLSSPFGIAPTPYGGVFVAYGGSGKLARFDANGAFAEEISTGLSNVQPFDVIAVPTGAWFSDQQSNRAVRLVDGIPTAATGAIGVAQPILPVGAGTAEPSYSVAGTVDTLGNDTQVSFEYGTTTAYGSTTTPVTVGASAGGAVPANATLTGLARGTTYHVRAKATSSRGTGFGADLTFTTAAAPAATPTPTPTPTPDGPSPLVLPPLPPVKATISVKSTAKGTSTTITSLSVKGLLGGETIKVACAAKKKGACPFKSKTQRKAKKGTRSLSTLFGKKRPVKVGAVVTITISANGKRPAVLTLTIRKGKTPKKVSG
jgi:streptogramin lyase